MRSAVAVTLIIAGAILIAIPPLSDYLMQLNVVSLLRDGGHVNLTGQMSDVYRFGCWLTGSLMIGIAIKGSFAARPA